MSISLTSCLWALTDDDFATEAGRAWKERVGVFKQKLGSQHKQQLLFLKGSLRGQLEIPLMFSFEIFTHFENLELYLEQSAV